MSHEGQSHLLVHFVVTGLMKDDLIALPRQFANIRRKRIEIVVVPAKDKTAQGQALAHVVQDRGSKNGVGPEVSLCFLYFLCFQQRQFVLLAQGKCMFQYLYRVNKEPAGNSMVVCL